MNSDPDLRLVPPDEKTDPGETPPAPESRDQSDLIAELLAETGMLPPDKLEDVRARALGGSFSQALLDEGLATSLGIARRLAEQYHLPLVDLAEAGVDAEAARVIPLAVLERVCAIPFAFDGETLRIAITDPQNVRGLDELRLATQHPVAFHVAAQADVLAEMRRISRASGGAQLSPHRGRSRGGSVRTKKSTTSRSTTGSRTRRSCGSSTRSSSRRPRRAPATSTSSRRRTRSSSASAIDGVLRVAQRIPTQLSTGVTTRLKVLAKLDIAERRRPQDGRISLNAAAAGRLLDIRVATLPTVDGESVTMRLLDKSRSAPTLEELGLSDEMRAQLSQIVSPADGGPARDRPDRLGEVDDALRSARRDQPARGERHHGRGSGRVPARRHQPGADQPARGPDVRDRAALDPPLRPRRRDGRRDPRRRDRQDLDRGGA